MNDEIDSAKMHKLLLQLNKAGLSYLRCNDFQSAISYFKKAEKIAIQQQFIRDNDPKINQITAVTFNNLACYYQKTKKPKVALSYLKKTLEIQVNKMSDWVSISSTHLNICAIYSYLNKHEDALNHVELALKLLQKQTCNQNDQTFIGKSFRNIKMLCFYNKAIQEQHLRSYQKSLDSYRQTKELAKLQGSKNTAIINICDQAINRYEKRFQSLKQHMLNILLKRQEDDQNGHYEYMRKNVRNFKGQKIHSSEFNTGQLIQSSEFGGNNLKNRQVSKYSQASLVRIQNTSRNKRSQIKKFRSKTQTTGNNQ